MTLILLKHSAIQLLVVGAVILGGLLWMGTTDVAHAGGKGAKVETTSSFEEESCFPLGYGMEFCDTAAGRIHKVETPSGNVLTTVRIEELHELVISGTWGETRIFLSSDVIKENRLDKDGETHTLRSSLISVVNGEECHSTFRITNGGEVVVATECVPVPA